MALIKLYESANPIVLYGTEALGYSSSTFGWYERRHDCVVFNNGAFQSTYKIYRDGTVCRACNGDGLWYAYDADLDLRFLINISGPANYYTDPISTKWDASHLARFTSQGFTYHGGTTWNGVHYRISAATVTKSDMAGATLGTFSLTGSISPFIADTLAITTSGVLVGIDDDNGTYGVVRFYNLYTGTVMHTSVIDKATRTFVDTVNNNIWAVNQTTKKMQVYSFDVAPSSFSSITMGANRCRYREDDLSVTLSGSASEPVPNWPVKWTLSTSEGHLQEEVVLTNSSGVATNVYCGPGATDYVGGSQTITVETGY